jgi:hypothetical protein
MKRMIYQLLMSVSAGAVIGGIVVNLVNILDPEIEIDYEVAIAFFSVLTWGAFSLIDTLFRKPEPAPASATSTSTTTPTAPARR